MLITFDTNRLWMAGATPVLFDVARAVRGSDAGDAHGGARIDAGSRRAPARAKRARDRGAARGRLSKLTD